MNTVEDSAAVSPETLLAVRGHDEQRQLLRSVDSSSLLFTGPQGVGRRRTARWYAALLNCQAPSDERPCGECASCRLFVSGHPDYREVQPRWTTSTGRRKFVPEIVIGQLVTRPKKDQVEDPPLSRWLEGRPSFRTRVAVIDGAEYLNLNAANSFLKMLEEPPSYSRIVLIAASAQSLLPTVASRCTQVRFGAVDTTGLGADDHPAHRLGTPGPLLEPAADFEETAQAVDDFVAASRGPLREAIAAADVLARRWQEASEGSDVTELLRDRLRALPPAARTRADDLILACEEAIAGYTSAPLAVRVLLLELRALLQ